MRGLAVMTVLVALVLGADVVSGGFIREQVRAASAVVASWARSASASVSLERLFFWRPSESGVSSQEFALLSERAAEAEALRRENDELRQLVHLAANTPGTTAPVVSSLHASPYGTFLIQVGADDRVGVGDLVLSSGGFVIGRVQSAGFGTALVAELLAPGASLEATLNGASITLEGDGSGRGRTQAPRGLAVSVGDTVVAPTLGQRPVGVVGAIASSSAGAAQEVYVRLPSGLSGLRFVYVAPGF